MVIKNRGVEKTLYAVRQVVKQWRHSSTPRQIVFVIVADFACGVRFDLDAMLPLLRNQAGCIFGRVDCFQGEPNTLLLFKIRQRRKQLQNTGLIDGFNNGDS